ncbi:MAG: toll/interleukin-1 receptor domain-containing protein [Nitrospira defluvii]|nr:toll/interleukin-1 receptor domain-containing protein [Nitrospira defluvii]
MREVFISHVESDGALALEMVAGLEAAGYTTWYYERDSIPGPTYLAQVGKAIDEAKALLVLISRASIDSHQVENEIVRAYENRTPLFPVLFGVSHRWVAGIQSSWRQAFGAATSISVPPAGIAEVIPKLISGLGSVGLVSPKNPNPSPEGRTQLLSQTVSLLQQLPAVIVGHVEVGIPYGYFMKATDQRDTGRMLHACAEPTSHERGKPNPHGQDVVLSFDLTSRSELQLRIRRVFVEVLEYVPVAQVETAPVMSAGDTRRYFCNLEPAVGTYDAVQLDGTYDFLKLSSGELEHFEISVNTTVPGIFRVRVGAEYVVAGENKTTTSAEVDKMIGFF